MCEGLVIGIISIRSVVCEGLVIRMSIDSTIGSITNIRELIFYYRNAELTFLRFSLACFFLAFLVIIFLLGVAKTVGM